MKIKKKFSAIFNILILIMLSSCVQSTASFFGPTMTIIKTGSVHQSGLSYVSGKLVRVQFEKFTTKNLKDILIKDSELRKSVIIIDKTADLNLTIKPENITGEYNNFLDSVKKVLK